MKILILTPNYPRKSARMHGVFIHRQVKALQALGVECHVLLLRNWYPPFGLHKRHNYWAEGYLQKQDMYDEYEGIRIHQVPVFLKMPDRLFKNDLYEQAATALTRYIKSSKELQDADWLYAHFLTDMGYIGTKVKQGTGIKLAAIARGDDVHAWPENNPSLISHLREVFKKADLLIANSGRLAEDTKKWMDSGIIKEVYVVYNGIDYDMFRPVQAIEEKHRLREKYGLSNDKKYIVCIATPVALKGWVELIDAIKECGDGFKEWQLLAITPPRRHKDVLDLASIANNLGIGDKINCMGQRDPHEVAEILRASEIFVLPSYNEGMANALLEAMASGVACIATNVGGHSEVIRNNEDGILIEPKSVPELIGALSKMLIDPDLRTRLGKNARERMLLFGNYSDNSRKLAALLSTM